jgi:hypothetical protein
MTASCCFLTRSHPYWNRNATTGMWRWMVMTEHGGTITTRRPLSTNAVATTSVQVQSVPPNQSPPRPIYVSATRQVRFDYTTLAIFCFVLVQLPKETFVSRHCRHSSNCMCTQQETKHLSSSFSSFPLGTHTHTHTHTARWKNKYQFSSCFGSDETI